jgi:hypothetical protein
VILSKVCGRGLLCDEQLGFSTKFSTALQLAHLVERVSSNFGEKGLTFTVFLDIVKAFDAVQVNSLLYMLTILNFPLYLVKLIYSYLFSRTFEAFFQSSRSTVCGMGAGMARGGIISHVSSSLYVSNMPMPP